MAIRKSKGWLQDISLLTQLCLLSSACGPPIGLPPPAIEGTVIPTIVISPAQITPTLPSTPIPTIKPVQTDASSPLDQPSPTPSQTPFPSPTPTLTPTLIPVLPTVTDWQTYTSLLGVSIQYPKNWQYHMINSPDYVLFRLDAAKDLSPYYWINFEVYDRPIKQRRIANPHNWEPNEGGYVILWEKPIRVDGIPGIEFVWGAYREEDTTWDSAPSLNAILYSASDQLDIRLTAYFDLETADFAMENGFDVVVQEKYEVYHHMLQSIRITRKN